MRLYLKTLRESSGMSQQEVADKIGISKQYYQMIESGERQRKMDITLVKSLASIFNLSIEDICNYEANLNS